MDKNLEKIRRLHIKECMKNLERNNMKAFFAKDKKEVLDIVKSLVKEGEKVSVGGSMSLFECGVIDFLKNGNFRFLDRYKEGLTREEIEKIYRESFFCDHYFTSANAITRDGCLYNVDGNSNRVAAMLYGPKSVIVIAGANKIVDSFEDAIKRVKMVAAPANSERLSCQTPCREDGLCVSLKMQNPQIYDGCKTEARICCNYVVSAYQRHKDRIKVILCLEDLGY